LSSNNIRTFEQGGCPGASVEGNRNSDRRARSNSA